MTKRKKNPELKVVFDTNSLYTGSASDLLNKHVAQIIIDKSKLSDLTVSWHLPETVVHERQFQMESRGLGLLPSVEKLERLLGHNLNITDDIIKSRVSHTINNQLSKFNINVLTVNINDVDWQRIIKSAGFREPPFSAGEKEKGFRDALTAEAFMQLVASAPSTPRYCRIAIVTKDTLLIDHLRERNKSNNNIRFIKDLEELKSLINTLASEVKEEIVESIKPHAALYFFEPQNKDTLYYKEKIVEKIREAYKDKLQELHPDGGVRENGTWYISEPRFVKKVRQRISWISQVSVESKAYKYVQKESSGQGLLAALAPPLPFDEGVVPGRIGNQGLLAALAPPLPPQTLGQALNTEKVNLANGFTVFEIAWSVTVSTNKKLRNPQIDSINFVEINWEENQA